MRSIALVVFVITAPVLLLGSLSGCNGGPQNEPLPMITAPDASVGKSVQDTSHVDITFLGNQGVLIDDGDKRVIIDGLHRGANSTGWTSLPAAQRVLLQNAQPPFDSDDVAMITHNHLDHYSVFSVGQHLNCNPDTRLLTLSGVRGTIQSFYQDWPLISSQVITNVNPAPGQRVSTLINGVQIEVLNMLHFTNVCGPCGRNFAYIVTLGDIKMLHLGDVDMLNQENQVNFDLANEDIDIVFLPTPFPSFVTSQQRSTLMSWINPKHVIALHVSVPNQAQVVANLNIVYPEATVLLQPLEAVRFLNVDF